MSYCRSPIPFVAAPSSRRALRSGVAGYGADRRAGVRRQLLAPGPRSHPGPALAVRRLTFLDAGHGPDRRSGNTASGRLYTVDVTRDGPGTSPASSAGPCLRSVGESDAAASRSVPVVCSSRRGTARTGSGRPGPAVWTRTRSRCSRRSASPRASAAPSSCRRLAGRGPVQGRLLRRPRWYTVPLTPDGTGTYARRADRGHHRRRRPESIASCAGSPLSLYQAVLISEYQGDLIVAYNVRCQRQSVPATGRRSEPTSPVRRAP